MFIKPAIYIYIRNKYRIPPGKARAFGAKRSNKRKHTEKKDGKKKGERKIERKGKPRS